MVDFGSSSLHPTTITTSPPRHLATSWPPDLATSRPRYLATSQPPNLATSRASRRREGNKTTKRRKGAERRKGPRPRRDDARGPRPRRREGSTTTRGGTTMRGAALDAIFLYQIWWTAQQPYICTWDNCPPPKIWSHGCLAAVAARGGCGVSSDRLPYLGYLFQFWWDHFATCDFKFGSIQMLGTQLCHILASNVNKYKYQVSGGMTDAILGNHIWHIQKWQYLS